MLIAIGVLVTGALTADPTYAAGLRLVGWALLVTGLAGYLWLLYTRHGHAIRLRAAGELIRNDTQVAFVTNEAGDIRERNLAARTRFHDPFVDTLGFVLTDIFANPGAVLFRMQSRAQSTGFASEDIVTRAGAVRLTVQRMGEDIFLWRLLEEGERQPAARGGDALTLPMLTAGPSGTILYMNEAFRRLMGGRVKSLDAVFSELPLVSGRRHRVMGVDGPVHCIVAEVQGSGGRREVYLIPGEGEAPDRAGPGWDAIEEMPVPLLKVAVGGEILEANRQARDLLHADMGRDPRLGDLLDGLGRPIAEWLRDAARTTQRTTEPEFLRITNAPSERFVQVALNPAGPEGERHLIIVLKDVTEFKSLEAQFVQSQKMQAIGQLAGGVAHDFNNLLTAISGHCDLLLLRHDQGDPDYSDLVQIHQNANRAASLVGQLLAFSRKQNLRPQHLDLRDTLSDLTHLLNRLVGERITLSLSHDPGLSPIRGDKRQLEQVLMNLVVNARDAMPAGGEIRIWTENFSIADQLERDRATVPPGDYVALHVADAGIGIPPEMRAKIFEPFYTTKESGDGTGLGLSTVYGIVKQTGGYIFVDSEEGKGTTFTLYFPARDDGPEKFTTGALPGPDVAPAEPQVDDDAVVLLVEDEAPVRAFASRALRLRGYTVLEASCAEDALDMLSDAALKVDIFVTDVVMPGKNGPTWVREALGNRPDTRVVFVSGYAEESIAENQTRIPNSVFLPKPFSLTELTTTVRQQLH
ncbi:response regulator [Pelagovum pacificum]|nr:ATP-binding protein [Pelagovum pacificum]QQA44944.1 response regulator [Pelagovum pacificum]